MRNDERGVSPVIGVVLMVAITVILAAIVASFVFGMAGTMKRTYNLAASAEKICGAGGCNISIVYHGGPDHQYLNGTRVSVIKKDGTTSSLSCLGNLNNINSAPDVGASCISAYSPGDVPYTVVVGAVFRDGTEQVILRTSIS
ncbi:MAG: type IV pilin N-terminal domain-containing protein [Archaeoglobaceae archaeon]|nr:type IV pilin N-terminal domain-containing protein [Archaeoglobaceae archaeon]